MITQNVELAGRRFVILPEEDFQKLEREAHPSSSAAAKSRPKFASVTPLKVSGIPASEILIQNRR